MCGSGAVTGMMTVTIRGSPRKTRRTLKRALTACFAAVAGATTVRRRFRGAYRVYSGPSIRGGDSGLRAVLPRVQQ